MSKLVRFDTVFPTIQVYLKTSIHDIKYLTIPPHMLQTNCIMFVSLTVHTLRHIL